MSRTGRNRYWSRDNKYMIIKRLLDEEVGGVRGIAKHNKLLLFIWWLWILLNVSYLLYTKTV